MIFFGTKKKLKEDKRKAVNSLIRILFTYDDRIQCWDPIGSIDAAHMRNLVRAIIDNKIVLRPAIIDKLKLGE